VAFLKVDIGEHERLASRYDISVRPAGLPRQAVAGDGKVISPPIRSHRTVSSSHSPRHRACRWFVAPLASQAVPTFLCFLNGKRLPGSLVGAETNALRATVQQLAASAEGESDSEG